MQHLRIKVALALRPNVYAPNESPPAQRLYVIFNGLAHYRGKTLTKHDHCAADTRSSARAAVPATYRPSAAPPRLPLTCC
jgi:hypothetical protein